VTAVFPEYFVEEREGVVELSEDGQEGGFCGHDVVDGAGGLVGAVAEGEAVLVELE